MYVFTKIGSSFEKTQVPLESVLSVLLFVLYGGLSAQETISLDGEWSFWTPDHPQTTVNVPHTFNVMDGLESYAGKAFYSREVPVGPQQKGKKLRVQFNGVFHDAVVYVNGQKAGEHLNAGYTPFSFDITPFIDYSPGVAKTVRGTDACADGNSQAADCRTCRSALQPSMFVCLGHEQRGG